MEIDQCRIKISLSGHARRNKLRRIVKYCTPLIFQQLRWVGVRDQRWEWISQWKHARGIELFKIAKSCRCHMFQWWISFSVEYLWQRFILWWQQARINKPSKSTKFGRPTRINSGDLRCKIDNRYWPCKNQWFGKRRGKFILLQDFCYLRS